MRKAILGTLFVLGTSTVLMAGAQDGRIWHDDHRGAENRDWRFDRGAVNTPGNTATSTNSSTSTDDSVVSDDDSDFARVPEIDPTAGMSALALIAGAVLVLRGRRTKKA